MSRKKRFLLALVGLVSLAATRARASAEIPGEVLAHLRLAHPPAAFAVLPGDQVYLLDDVGKRLIRAGLDQPPEAFPLRGAGFDPARSRLVDLGLAPGGGLLVLDAEAGTMWRTALDGRITGRAGTFLHPVELGRGPAGGPVVWDPGVPAVTAFDTDLDPVGHAGGLAMAAAQAPDGSVPFFTLDTELHELRVRARDLEENPHPDAPLPAPRSLGRLPLCPDEAFVDASILGAHAGAVIVRVLSVRPDRPSQSRVAVWGLRVQGEDAGSAYRLEVPWVPSECLDCGPDLRLGADGNLYLFVLRGDEYWVTRLTVAGGRS